MITTTASARTLSTAFLGTENLQAILLTVHSEYDFSRNTQLYTQKS